MPLFLPIKLVLQVVYITSLIKYFEFEQPFLYWWRKCYQPARSCLDAYNNKQSILCLKDYDKLDKTVVSISETHLGLMYIPQKKLGRGSNMKKWCIYPP